MAARNLRQGPAADNLNSVPDEHVHSEWSYDAQSGSMLESCRKAVALGLSAVAFTEHAEWSLGLDATLDVAGYLECVAKCRASFPSLKIFTGVEMGEPHRYPSEAAALLGSAQFDRKLASIHRIRIGDQLHRTEEFESMRADRVHDAFAGYLASLLEMIESNASFDVIAHLDYPKRYWPAGIPYDERSFEDEFRAVLRAAAKRPVAVELNTTGGRDPARFLCPGPRIITWWSEEGGRALTLGSDAHRPDEVGAGLALAQQLAESAGFKPGHGHFWVR